MKQIVDKLNKIAKAIDSDVTISNRKLIIDSLDSITKAFGGTPNDSKLIVDKLEDIANYVHGGGGTYTETYQFIKGGTYTATSPNLFLDIGSDTDEILPYTDVTLNINGEDCVFEWQEGSGQWECAEKQYSINGTGSTLSVEEPGTYTIAPCNITLTGNAVDLVMQPGSLYTLEYVVVDGKDYTYRFRSSSEILERKLIIDRFFIMATPM